MPKFLKKIFLNDYVYCFVFVTTLLVLISIIPINHELSDPFSEALADFEITDLAFTKLRASEPSADTSIIIINTGNSNNAQLGAIISIINENNPSVIGINLTLKKSDQFGDSILTTALKDVKNLVFAVRLKAWNDTTKEWNELEVSDDNFTIFKTDSGTSKYSKIGFNNLFTTDKDFKTTRHFYSKTKVKGLSINLFPAELVKIVHPEKVKKYAKRNNNHEVINYIGNIDKFTVLDGDQVLKREFAPEAIRGKIIMLGYMGESLSNEKFWDVGKYYTPINDKYAGKTFPDMFETVIYANIASQILSESHIKAVSPSVDLLINLLICFLNVVLFSILFHSATVWWDTMSLVITMVETVVLLLSTALIFSYYGIEINLNISIVFVLVLGTFLELYYGLFKIIIQRMSVKYYIAQEADKRQKLKSLLSDKSKSSIMDTLKNLNDPK